MDCARLLAILAASSAQYTCAYNVPVTQRSAAAVSRTRASGVRAQFGFKVQKSERLLIREAWEKADAYRPGQANWFTKQQKDLVGLHKALIPEYEALPSLPPPTNATSLLGSLLKVLTTGDLALTLCSPEPPVLTQLRDWLVEKLPMPEAVLGLPEEQGRVLSTIVRSLDARKILDLGTFTGYSAIAMALAAANDARVICCEPKAAPARAARDWFLKAGVSSKMEMHEEEASPLLERMLSEGAAGTVDMVFVDIGERHRYPEVHEMLMKLVRVGGVVIYYDTLWSSDEVQQHDPYPIMRQFNKDIAEDPRLIATLVPLSYGLTLCVKTVSLEGETLREALEARRERSDHEPLLALLRARREELRGELTELNGAAAVVEAQNAVTAAENINVAADDTVADAEEVVAGTDDIVVKAEDTAVESPPPAPKKTFSFKI